MTSVDASEMFRRLSRQLESDRVRAIQNGFRSGQISVNENLGRISQQIELGQLDATIQESKAEFERLKRQCASEKNAEFLSGETNVVPTDECDAPQQGPELPSMNSQIQAFAGVEMAMAAGANGWAYLAGRRSGYEAMTNTFEAGCTGAVRGCLYTLGQHLSEGISVGSSVGFGPQTFIFMAASELTTESVQAIKRFWSNETDLLTMGALVSRSMAKSAAKVGGMALGVMVGNGIAAYFKISPSTLSPLFALLGYYGAGQLVESIERWFNGVQELPQDAQRAALLARSYEILEVPATATDVEVRRSYLRLALELHPDRGGSHEQMLQLNAAYELIRIARGAN